MDKARFSEKMEDADATSVLAALADLDSAFRRTNIKAMSWHLLWKLLSVAEVAMYEGADISELQVALIKFFEG